MYVAYIVSPNQQLPTSYTGGRLLTTAWLRPMVKHYLHGCSVEMQCCISTIVNIEQRLAGRGASPRSWEVRLHRVLACNGCVNEVLIGIAYNWEKLFDERSATFSLSRYHAAKLLWARRKSVLQKVISKKKYEQKDKTTMTSRKTVVLADETAGVSGPISAANTTAPGKGSINEYPPKEIIIIV